MMANERLQFRVWDINSKEFISLAKSANELSITLDGYFAESNQTGYYLHNTSSHVIQRWTGLVDKNDIKIYEGDIIKANKEHAPYTESIGEIVWHHSYWALDGYKLFIFDDDSFEIIGNIFETPELLKS